jgi:sugar phosphate isomerase/epimerase
MPGPAREDEAELAKFIELFNETAMNYAPYGMKLTYHHHSFEFKKLSDGRTTLFDKLVEGFTEPNISFVLDTYWLQHGGKDIRATIEQLAGRVDILHLKDMEAMRRYAVAGTNTVYFAPGITEVGSGNINFKDIIPLAEKCGAKYFVVEDDRAVDVGSYDAVRKSADYIKAELLEK